MQIKLSQPFGRTSPVDGYDVLQMKKALNRLGYYQPYEKVGITDIPDSAAFDALKSFQRDRGLPSTGEAKPDDETVMAINRDILRPPQGKYIWRIVEDGKARPAHARYNRMVRDWADAPDPGDDFNCRCWAEAYKKVEDINDPPLEPVYPELVLIPVLKAKTFVNLLSIPISKVIKNSVSAEIKMNDTSTWPDPPVSGKIKEGLPSRQKPRNRGEKSLFDERGGEWRYAKEDEYHNPHWDYKSSRSSSWENIEINSKPTQKNGR